MATCAFKSTTKRSSDASSSSRSRSLSSSRGRFVNTVRGSSAFPEMSLDPLVDDDDHHRPRRCAPPSQRQSQRRSRSVSRPHSDHHRDTTTSNTCSSTSRGTRRRSASVARYRFSDSESEDHSRKSRHHANVKSYGSWNYRKPSVTTPVSFNHQHILERSSSQNELSKSCDGDSSHSSALTDEEPRDTHSNKNGRERTIQATYLQKKIENPIGGVATELYEVMRKELRHAVNDIRTEIEQSEKRKQDLLAAIVAEEQRGRELSKIVKELLPDPKNTSIQEKSSLGRQNNDRSWMSKCLSEDAEKYFGDFLSNVEDTDISSFDGERSDASSSIGMKKPKDLVLHSGERETTGLSARSVSLPVEMDGVVLPWLQWETSNDGSPLLCKNRVDVSVIPEDNLCSSAQGGMTESCGSCVFPGDDSGGKSHLSMEHVGGSEESIFEAWRQRQKITCGALILCCSTIFS